MDTSVLIYLTFGLAALGALAVYMAAPRGGQARRIPAIALGIAAIVSFAWLVLQRHTGSAGSKVALTVLAVLSVGGAVRVITHPKPVYSALYFVLVALSSATLVLLVGAEFLWVAIVAVYAGAILVTYLFVIMLAQQSDVSAQDLSGIEPDALSAQPFQGSLGIPRSGPLDYDRDAREPLAAVFAGFVLMAITAGLLLNHAWPATRAGAAVEDNTFGLGKILLADNAVALELAGVLLLVAMVGAIAIARKRVVADVTTQHEDELPPGEIGRHVKPF